MLWGRQYRNDWLWPARSALENSCRPHRAVLVDAWPTYPHEKFSRAKEGRWAGTYWQPAVFLPRSANPTCGFPASGFPTGFTAPHTEAIVKHRLGDSRRASSFAVRHSLIENIRIKSGVTDSSSMAAPLLFLKHTRSKDASLHRHYPASTVPSPSPTSGPAILL